MINTVVKSVVIALITYFVGNISPASILGRISKVDIREEGSGNPGTTNVIRVLGLKAGLITLLIDLLKGFIAVTLGFSMLGFIGGIVGFSAVVLGHCYPVAYGFKGGKGVATTFGAAIAISWPAAIVAFFVALICLLKTGKMSIGSLSAAIVFPVLILFYAPEYFLFSLFVAAFIIIKHIPNIKRLKAGEESTIDIKQKIKDMKNKKNNE